MKLRPEYSPLTMTAIVLSVICIMIWGYMRVTNANLPFWLDVVTFLALGGAIGAVVVDAKRGRKSGTRDDSSNRGDSCGS